MNEAIQRFVDELAADPAVRGIILFGSHARGNARADSDADLVILGERDQFEMGFTERDPQAGQENHSTFPTALPAPRVGECATLRPNGQITKVASRKLANPNGIPMSQGTATISPGSSRWLDE